MIHMMAMIWRTDVDKGFMELRMIRDIHGSESPSGVG